MERIKQISTARELLQVLQHTPDYMLDLPVVGMTPDGMIGFEITLIEVLDLIEDGNRITMIRVSGEEEM